MRKTVSATTGYASGAAVSMNDSEKESEFSRSRRLILEHAMKQYGITNEDLQNSSLVVSRLREKNIDTVLS